MSTLEKRIIDTRARRKFSRPRAHAAVVMFGSSPSVGVVRARLVVVERCEGAWTISCRVVHRGVCGSGQMTVRADDGPDGSFGPGAVFVMRAGHDVGVDGDEASVMFDALLPRTPCRPDGSAVRGCSEPATPDPGPALGLPGRDTAVGQQRLQEREAAHRPISMTAGARSEKETATALWAVRSEVGDRA